MMKEEEKRFEEEEEAKTGQEDHEDEVDEEDDEDDKDEEDEEDEEDQEDQEDAVANALNRLRLDSAVIYRRMGPNRADAEIYGILAEARGAVFPHGEAHECRAPTVTKTDAQGNPRPCQRIIKVRRYCYHHRCRFRGCENMRIAENDFCEDHRP